MREGEVREGEVREGEVELTTHRRALVSRSRSSYTLRNPRVHHTTSKGRRETGCGKGD